MENFNSQINEIQNRLQNIEKNLNLIMDKLNIKENKKEEIDLIKLYGLKPLSYYKDDENNKLIVKNNI